MRQIIGLIAFSFGSLLASKAQASTANWFVRADAKAPLELARGETVSALSLIPQRVFELTSDVIPAGSKFPVRGGSLFVPVDGEKSGKFCAMARHLGSAFHCLADRDGDGSIESYYYQQVFNKFYFGSTFGEDGRVTLQAPANLRELDPFTQIEPIALGLRFNGGKPGTQTRFKLCVEEPSGAANWRKGLYKTCLRKEFSADPATGKLDLLGLKAQVDRIDDKRVSITFAPDLRIVPVTFNGTSL